VAQAANLYNTSRFHNLSNEMLADAIGNADAVLKGAEAECRALNDEFQARGLLNVVGELFTVTRSEQIAGRLDTKAVKEFLGESYHRFEMAVVSTVVRIRAAKSLAGAA
jgi:hypothetical protein